MALLDETMAAAMGGELERSVGDRRDLLLDAVRLRADIGPQAGAHSGAGS